MGKGPDVQASESKSQIPMGQVGAVTQRPTMPMQFQKPFAMQPTASPNMATALAQGGTQARPVDPRMALNMLRQRQV